MQDVTMEGVRRGDLGRMRLSLLRIPVSKRRAWAEKHPAPTCASCAEEKRICAYPTHWSGEKLLAAFNALAKGIRVRMRKAAHASKGVIFRKEFSCPFCKEMARALRRVN